jgi:hypothetical protein
MGKGNTIRLKVKVKVFTLMRGGSWYLLITLGETSQMIAT